MSDVQTETAEAGAASDSIVKIAITKGGDTIEVDVNALPQDVFREAIMQGLKTILNRGMSKLKKTDQGTPEAAMKIAQENLAKCMEGKIRFTAGGKTKADKLDREVKTEALRLAKAIVKDAIKADGGKISHYSASDITTAAKAYLEDNPETIELAKENLERRKAAPVKVASIKIKADPKLVAKAEEANAKRKANKPLSAKQAGMPAKRKKGQPEATAH